MVLGRGWLGDFAFSRIVVKDIAANYLALQRVKISDYTDHKSIFFTNTTEDLKYL
jgi:hypothetical protein